MQSRKKVAIVGSGCTGIAALWALKSTDHEVHLYEAADRLGATPIQCPSHMETGPSMLIQALSL